MFCMIENVYLDKSQRLECTQVSFPNLQFQYLHCECEVPPLSPVNHAVHNPLNTQLEVLLCQSVASLCHMEVFFSLSALIPERGKGAPADVPTPKSCECKGEPLVSVSHSCLSWVGESRRPGAARGNRKLGQAQLLCWFPYGA